MDIAGIIFVLILLIVSGFVAWAGDVLGRVLGKRRISLFGLRPRRTSVLIAVVTGILITGGTILTLALVNENVRYMLREMGTIRHQLSDLQGQLDDLSGERDEIIIERDAARQGLDHAMTEIYVISTQLSTAEEDLVTAQEKASELGDEVAEKEAEVEDLESQITILNKDIAVGEARLAELNSEVDSLNLSIANLNGRIDSLNREITSLAQQVTELSGQVEIMVSGEIKVYEGQQLAVFSIDTSLGIDEIYSNLQYKINGISGTYRDPLTGSTVLANNVIDITSAQYYEALEDIRDISSDYAVVIVYADANVVEDQSVPVRLEITRNYKVYSQGTTIYSNTYTEPGIETEQSYRALFAQFFEDARDYIVNESRLIPFTSGEALQLSIDDLLDLSGRLAESDFPVELKLIALTDIYRTDFLVYGEEFTVTILPISSSDVTSAPE